MSIKICDKLSVDQDRPYVISYKIEDIMVEESDSDYYPLELLSLIKRMQVNYNKNV